MESYADDLQHAFLCCWDLQKFFSTRDHLRCHVSIALHTISVSLDRPSTRNDNIQSPWIIEIKSVIHRCGETRKPRQHIRVLVGNYPHGVNSAAMPSDSSMSGYPVQIEAYHLLSRRNYRREGEKTTWRCSVIVFSGKN